MAEPPIHNDKYTKRQLDRLQSAGKAAASVEKLLKLRGVPLYQLRLKPAAGEICTKEPILEVDPEFREVISRVFDTAIKMALEESIDYLEECAALAYREAGAAAPFGDT